MTRLYKKEITFETNESTNNEIKNEKKMLSNHKIISLFVCCHDEKQK